MVLTKKISVLGAPGVGKTSLVRRFVGLPSRAELPGPAIQVRLEKRRLVVADQEVQLVVWDFTGVPECEALPVTRLGGTAGYVLVADGTRPETLREAMEWQARITASPALMAPFVLVLNQADRQSDWQVADTHLEPLVHAGWSILRASARSGENVEFAFHQLAAACMPRTVS